MLRYLFKKTLQLVPSLWIITSLVFLLSKSATDLLTPALSDQEQIGRHGKANAESEARIFRQYRHKTGQDLPLFYLQLQSLADPDTLHRVLASRDRTFLEKMLWRTGNWPAIVRVYEQLRLLEQQANALPDLALRRTFQRQIHWLFRKPDQVPILLPTMERSVQETPTGTRLLAQLASFQTAFRLANERAERWRNWVPIFHWNGVENQYHRWFAGIFRGDWGTSYRDSRPVITILWEGITLTFLLIGISLTASFGLATLLSVWLALPAQYRWRTPILNFLYILDTIPLFILSFLILLTLLLTGLSAHLPLYGLPSSYPGEGTLQHFIRQLPHYLVPALCLTLATLPYLTSQVFQALKQVEPMEYIQTARAKGLSEYQVVGKHALHNALFPLITVLTGFLPSFVGGALVIEVIFAIPGMGRLLSDAVLARDYPVVMGIVLALALVKLLSLLLADILYYLTDPRVRF